MWLAENQPPKHIVPQSLDPVNVSHPMAKKTFLIELRLGTLKQGDYPGGLNVITLVLQRGRELIRDEMRQKNS